VRKVAYSEATVNLMSAPDELRIAHARGSFAPCRNTSRSHRDDDDVV